MLFSLRLLSKFVELQSVIQSVCPYYTKASDSDSLCVLETLLLQQGFEIEAMNWVHQSTQFVFGRIVECHANPGKTGKLDKLLYAKVCVGDPQSDNHYKWILCGDKTIQVGQIVCVALPGAVVGNKTIAETTMQDCVSQGMLCSAQELGLPFETKNVWVVAPFLQQWQPHVPLDTYLGLPVLPTLGFSDCIIDIGITPNRPDALSHQGLAWEIYAGLTTQKKQTAWHGFGYKAMACAYLPEFEQNSVGLLQALQSKNKLITNTTWISKTALHPEIPMLLFGVDLDPALFSAIHTPIHIQAHLYNLGYAVKSLLVDAGQYLQILYGQPSHVYDKQYIESQTEFAFATHPSLPNTSNLTMHGLDGNKYTLQPGDIYGYTMPTHQVQTLVGVLGATPSSVSATTMNCIVELALPNGKQVRQMSRRHGIHTQAGFLFDKGVSAPGRLHLMTEFIGYLCSLLDGIPHHALLNIQNMWQGCVYNSLFIDAIQQQPVVVSYDTQLFGAITGFTLPEHIQQQILENLGYVVVEQPAVEQPYILWRVTVPIHRSSDVSCPQDIVEEILRMEGHKRITSTPLPMSPMPSFVAPSLRITHGARAFFSQWATECMDFNFIGSTMPGVTRCMLQNSIALQNPLNSAYTHMQTNGFGVLLEKLVGNWKQNYTQGSLFSVQRVFAHATNDMLYDYSMQNQTMDIGMQVSNYIAFDIHSASISNKPLETNRLHGIWYGLPMPVWNDPNIDINAAQVVQNLFFKVTEIVTEYVQTMTQRHIVSVENHRLPTDHCNVSFMQHNASCVFYVCGVAIGSCGRLQPSIQKDLEIPFNIPIVLLDINLGTLQNIVQILEQKQKTPEKPVLHSLTQPAMQQEFALQVDETVPVGQLSAGMESLFNQFCKSHNYVLSFHVPVVVSVFDIFHKPDGIKSVGIRYQWQLVSNTPWNKDAFAMYIVEQAKIVLGATINY
jgi:phenylalanyl-tRNA synthetase beta subunit